MIISRVQRERFYARVRRVHGSDCIVWTGQLMPEGYGRVHTSGGGEYAHRVAFFLEHGYLPDGVIRHICDVRQCVNPDHLEPGTQAENVEDMVHRGRHLYGEKHKSAILREADIHDIDYKSRIEGRTDADIADDYGVTSSTIAQAVTRKTWRHIPLPDYALAGSGEWRGRRGGHRGKLSESDVREIDRRVAAGDKQVDIARDYGMSTGSICDIVKRKIYRWVKNET